MFWSVPATLALEAAFMASGNDCAQPWSVIAMARWPQAAACLTAAAVSVSASMEDMVVCRCSSTRLSGAVSFLVGVGRRRIAFGCMTVSFS